MPTVYFGDFDSREDVAREFDVKLSADIEILFALYTTEPYSGNALVIGRDDKGLFLVSGSHCSCMGLEGQWDREDATVAQLRHTTENGTAYEFSEQPDAKEPFLALLERLQAE